MPLQALRLTLLTSACLIGLSSFTRNIEAQQELAQEADAKVLDHSHMAEEATSHVESEADIELKKRYSPYAGKGPADAPPNFGKSEHPAHVFFGDTHMHTANSGDAFMGGNSLGPEQAYRFARGEEVISSTGIPVRLSRPLDFMVVADHAEGLGIMYSVAAGNETLLQDPQIAMWSKQLNGTPEERGLAAFDVVKAQAGGTLPAIIKDPKVVGPIMNSVWQEYTAVAEKFNEPGRFTAMIGYEWTSVPGGNNLHRNVLFRDNKDKADQVFPFSSWNSEDPEKLWDWMVAFEAKTGGRLLAIPHNANLSNGRMFEPDTHSGEPLSKDYAERRARFEVLQEMIQTKGNSETHPLMSPNDEFAGDLGVAGWEAGNLTMQTSPLTREMMPTSYLRSGLLQGLKHEQSLGTNPFKFGFVGSTDAHNSLMSIEEDNFFGKLPIQEPNAKRWEHLSKTSSWDTKLGPEKKLYSYHYMAAGYAAVWATENTREALWDAMYRKEVYATSGSRMTVRFFGGWTFSTDDAQARDLASIGYAKGVPMGGDLSQENQGARAPSFLVAAMKDPQSGNLDRIQVVKGWVDKDNQEHEQIYEVVWSDMNTRKLDTDGKIPPVGDTVDVADASWKNTIGAAQLTGVWTDPDFDPSERSFYYLRVIEIPTPRWTAYDAKRFGITMSPDVPMKHQERAWTSPIWYTPGKM